MPWDRLPFIYMYMHTQPLFLYVYMHTKKNHAFKAMVEQLEEAARESTSVLDK